MTRSHAGLEHPHMASAPAWVSQLGASPRHILSLADLSCADVSHIVKRSLQLAGQRDYEKSLAGKVVGIYFRKTSTRTRASFTVGAATLGAVTVAFGPDDLQTNTGETTQDTGRVLSGYLDALVVRTAEDIREMEILADQADMCIINAMSDNEHPTQALADLSTIAEHFGRLEGTSVLYVGEGNNTAAALALALGRVEGAQLTVVTPQGYGLDQTILAKAQEFSREYGATIRHHHAIDDVPTGVDVVYTTRWQTTGTSKADPLWKEHFKPFSVTTALMKKVSKPNVTVFMHDLPAIRGEEVEDGVLDGRQSIAFRQARHKLFSAMAALEWCLLGIPGQTIGRA
jgi:ornithine carbamoyltransferase